MRFLLAGLLLTVLGPVLLQLIAWDDLGSIGRLALPAVPLALLAAVGLERWRSQDRRRGLACLIGAALLTIPAAFGLMDLVPALQTVIDDEGKLQAIVPGPLWLPANEAPAWIQSGACANAECWKTRWFYLPANSAAHRSHNPALEFWVPAAITINTAFLSGWPVRD